MSSLYRNVITDLSRQDHFIKGGVSTNHFIDNNIPVVEGANSPHALFSNNINFASIKAANSHLCILTSYTSKPSTTYVHVNHILQCP